MVIAIPLKAQLDNEDLRYALRSIDKFCPGYEVVIIGSQLPDWIKNVTWIDVGDIAGRKQLTIKRKIHAALMYHEEIFFSNDDIYFLQKMDPKIFPYYFLGDLDKVGESGARPLVIQLKKIGRPILNFDIHTPILYERKKFCEAMDYFHPDTIIKSAYCNYHNVDPVPGDDTKIFNQQKIELLKAKIAGKVCFSTTPQSIFFCLPMLNELFPEKSYFEL